MRGGRVDATHRAMHVIEPGLLHCGEDVANILPFLDACNLLVVAQPTHLVHRGARFDEIAVALHRFDHVGACTKQFGFVVLSTRCIAQRFQPLYLIVGKLKLPFHRDEHSGRPAARSELATSPARTAPTTHFLAVGCKTRLTALPRSQYCCTRRCRAWWRCWGLLRERDR